MSKRTKLLLTTLGAVALVVAMSPLAGAWRWRRASARAERALLGAAASDTTRPVTRDLSAVPPPVERYLRHVLQDDQRAIRLAEVEHEGTFQMGEDERGWRSFRSREVFTTRPAGFVWDATITFAPLTSVFVRDALIGNVASTEATVFGLFSVANQRNHRELDIGATQRWLAESIWFPTVLLPGNDVTWTPIDERRALASVSAADTVASIEFRFDETGDVIELFAPNRAREVSGRFVPTPWIVRCTDHSEWHGVRIPVQCAVAWQLPEGEFTYWRGRVTGVRYEMFGAQ